MPRCAGCWVLTKAQGITAPKGFGFAAGAAGTVRRVLHQGAPAVTITAGMWPNCPDLCAVLLISSIAASVSSTRGPDEPSITHLSPRSSKCWRIDDRSDFRITAAQHWSGQVYAVPLKVTDLEAASRTYLGASLIPRSTGSTEEPTS